MQSSPNTGPSDDYESEVDLASFIVIASKQKVYLHWMTLKEIGNIGFSIERRFVDNDKWEQIGFVSGQGEYYTQHEYNYEDEPGVTGLVTYRLRQTRIDGTYNYSRMVSVTIKQYDDIVLYENHPNPFIVSTNILFQIPDNLTGNVILKIHDVDGKDVRILYNKPVLPGYYNIEWNGCNDDGKLVSPGIYSCILETDSKKFEKKMMKLGYKPKFD